MPTQIARHNEMGHVGRSAPPAAISLVSAGTLAYEVLLTRLFSIIQWHHFAYPWRKNHVEQNCHRVRAGCSHHQPTEDQLDALHRQDVTPNEAREVDQLYNQLESSSERILREEPALEQ